MSWRRDLRGLREGQVHDNPEVGIAAVAAVAAVADVDGFEPALLRRKCPEPVDEVAGRPVCGLVRFPRAEQVAEETAACTTSVAVDPSHGAGLECGDHDPGGQPIPCAWPHRIRLADRDIAAAHQALSSSPAAGSRKGRNPAPTPAAKLYRPSMLMWTWPNGDSRATSSSDSSCPAARRLATAASM